MLPHDDQTGMQDDEQEETTVDGEVFHAAHENEENMLLGRRNDETIDGISSGSNTKQVDMARSRGVDFVNGDCVLCWDGKADHVLIPCGHICLCSRCCRRNIASLKRKCPVCNKAFDRSLKVYFAGVVSEA